MTGVRRYVGVVVGLASLLLMGGAHLRFLDTESAPLLMRHPTVNRTDIVFSFAGDLWSVPRDGGDARRLTDSPGIESNPVFSPDGSTIAFSGQYEGSTNVYVMSASGGPAKRLTWAPGGDQVDGWTNDGKSVIFSSSYVSETDPPKLFTVSLNGDLPQQLPFPTGTQASFSPDGSSLAYNPGFKWQQAWKRYRGGQTTPIWIGRMADSKVYEIPRKNSNDSDPMWVGAKVFFLSDRDGYVSLYGYDLNSKKVFLAAKSEGFDMKSATAGPDVIALEELGSIKLYDPKSGAVQKVNIRIAGDFPEVRSQYKDGLQSVAGLDVSPTGARLVVEARGEILTVPASKGDVRALTHNSSSAERSPSWSPDGKWIAYFSDASGEYKLMLEDAMGKGETKSIVPAPGTAYYSNPNWSPDSKKIAYSDNRHKIWILDIDSQKATQVDESPFENPTLNLTTSWSPDSKWLAYFRELQNGLTGVFLYNLDSGKSTQITSSLGAAKNPVFDKGGKYLYFVASTNVGPGSAWLDLSSYAWFNVVSNAYVIVLQNDEPSPFPPESDEEPVKPDAPANPAPQQPQQPPKKADFRIDLDGIDQRTLAIPMQGRNYLALLPGTPGSFFALAATPISFVTSPQSLNLFKFDMNAKQEMLFAPAVGGATVSANGQKVLFTRGAAFYLVPSAAPPQPGQGAVDMSDLKIKINPQEEWKQIFREAIRIQRDYFYDPGHHGVDLSALQKKYAPFMENISSRADLNYLLEDMLGELCVGHMFIQGGDIPGVSGVPTGLLGADYTFDQGRYKITRVYTGESWNPGLYAPLTQPGVNVKAGEYILAINGHEVTDKDNIYQRLEATAGKQVTLKVGPSADGTGSREVTVVPVGSEAALRRIGWMEDNRRKVEALSGGKLGYVHIPDTNVGGWVNFTRYYMSQTDKDGLIIDERFNHGGQVDDYMVDQMSRQLMSMWTSRYGQDFPSPKAQNYGPKVMVVNQYAGSGGDYFPWHFRKLGVGPIVGKRTWGGLVGILGTPNFVDGGNVTSPNVAFWNPDGPKWDVENHGVDPDIEVEFDPYLWRQGHDPQLERAVEEGMKLLAKQPKKKLQHPPYKDNTKIG